MASLKQGIYGQIRRDFVKTRSCTRYSVCSAVEAIDPQSDIRILGRLSDISQNGCYVDTISPFATSAAITLKIMRGKRTITTGATVIYSQIGMGMGLSFTTAEPEQVRLLLTWLSELGGATPRESSASNAGPGICETRENETPDVELQPNATKSTDHVLRYIFMELITLLSRKNIVKDSEVEAMLRRLWN